MQRCFACQKADTFIDRISFIDTALDNHPHASQPRLQSALLRDAFPPDAEPDTENGLVVALHKTSHADQPFQLADTAMTRYRNPPPNCLAVGISNGVRGAVVGSVFGLAMGLSTAVQSGYRGGAAATYAGQGALRNAAGFGAWTSLYAFSRCGLIRMRKRNDILNSALAGAFTGGVLTLISVRGHWRYSQSAILTNAGGSAMIAVMFDALNYI